MSDACLIGEIVIFINPVNLENDRPCAVTAAAGHRVLLRHPAFHDRAALQTGINISADGVPGL